jgi:steroid 5-alpha reductase family enzyme
VGVEERGEEDLVLTHPFFSLSLSLQFFFSFLMVGLTTFFLSQHLMVTRINSQGEYFVWVVVALALVVVLIWLGRFGKTIS